MSDTKTTKEITPIDALKNSVEAMKPQFSKSLPAHVKPDKFVRAVQNAIMNTKDLVSIERNSFWLACMKSAELGLMPNGKEAAIVPYKGVATYIPMYEGLLKLVRNSGEIKSIVTELVYASDKFDYWIDEHGPHLSHRPTFKDRGAIELVYCIVTTKDGAAYIEVMNMDEIDKVKASSRAQNGPWKTWPEEMMKKSVFRRIFKRLPKSSDLDQDLLEKGIESDEEMLFRDVNLDEKEKPAQQSRLKGMLGIKSKEKKDVVEVPQENDVVDMPQHDDAPMPDVIDIPSTPNFAPGEGHNTPPSNPNIPI